MNRTPGGCEGAVPLHCLAAMAAVLSTLLCGCASVEVADDGDSVQRVLDGWHEAASRGDDEAYLAAMTEDAFFLGTDPDEDWTYEAFAALVRDYFEEGRGWTYVPSRRRVRFSADGNTAWFFERLQSEKYGELRGSGVLVRKDGRWKIDQYNMTFTLPNGVTKDVVRLLRERRLESLSVKPLPAGLYFRPHLTYRNLCPGCATPTHAAILGPFEEADDARAAVELMRTVPLEPGYPMVVHTDELAARGEEGEGVVVVLGLFASELDATRWSEAHRGFLPDARVAELLDEDEAYEYLVSRSKGDRVGARRVVRVDSPRPVPAVLMSKLAAKLDRDRDWEPNLGELEPVCEISPGEFFVIEPFGLESFYYLFAPVYCADGYRALIPWEKTLLETVVARDECRVTLSQVVNAEGDMPTVRRWLYVDGARGCSLGEGDAATFSSSCSK